MESTHNAIITHAQRGAQRERYADHSIHSIPFPSRAQRKGFSPPSLRVIINNLEP